MNLLEVVENRLYANFQEFFVAPLVMSRVVDNSFSGIAAKQGEVIEVPLTSRIDAVDVVPGVVPPAARGTKIDSVNVRVDKWKQTDFYLTADDERRMRADANFIPTRMKSALISLAEMVNEDIANVYKKANLDLGTPGTTPFLTDSSILKQAKVLANKNKWLKKDRHLVLDADAEGNLGDLGQYRDVNRSGTDLTQIEGVVGRKSGFDVYETADVRYHTAGHIEDPLTTVDPVAAGAKVITLTVPSGKTVKFNAGDLLEIAGQPIKYSVADDVAETIGTGAAAQVSINLNQAIQATIASSATVSITGDGQSFVENMAFHRSSIAFANRILMPNEQGGGITYTPIIDPLTNISIVLEKSYQHQQTAYYLQVLYGFELVRPNGLIRIHG